MPIALCDLTGHELGARLRSGDVTATDVLESTLERVRDGRPLGQIGVEAAGTPISPADITVHVEDASSGGKAQAVATYLREAGFVVDLGVASPGTSADRIYWGNGFGKQPKVVQSYLVNMVVARDDGLVQGSDVVVVVGPAYQQRGVPGL